MNTERVQTMGIYISS